MKKKNAKRTVRYTKIDLPDLKPTVCQHDDPSRCTDKCVNVTQTVSSTLCSHLMLWKTTKGNTTNYCCYLCGIRDIELTKSSDYPTLGTPLKEGGISSTKTDKTQVYNTTVEVKSKHFNKFADLIGNQFKHGGDKYKLPGLEDREATDVISSVFGGTSQFDWILGTMMKYLFRFKNFNREKDLLKVATYCYILWLKQGNHLVETHDEDTKK